MIEKGNPSMGMLQSYSYPFIPLPLYPFIPEDSLCESS